MDGRKVDEVAAKRLGRNLFRARRRAGYSQEELATLCSLHRTEIGHVEPRRGSVEHFYKATSLVPATPWALASLGLAPSDK